MKEIFKTIPNYPDYQVSNLGRVKSLKQGKEKILKHRIVSGYPYVTLFKKGRNHFHVHRLVMMTFVDTSNGMIVNHKDSNKLNNRLDNLEYVTYRQNSQHGYSRKNTQSKYIGVTFHLKKWRAQIYTKGKNKHLGLFKTELDAHKAYLRALKELNEQMYEIT